MFTVKHIDANGVTRLYSAETIEVIQVGNQFDDGVYLDRDPGQPNEVSSEPRFAKHVILFGGDFNADAMGRKGGVVFVMNEAGATVDKYIL